MIEEIVRAFLANKQLNGAMGLLIANKGYRDYEQQNQQFDAHAQPDV